MLQRFNSLVASCRQFADRDDAGLLFEARIRRSAMATLDIAGVVSVSRSASVPPMRRLVLRIGDVIGIDNDVSADAEMAGLLHHVRAAAAGGRRSPVLPRPACSHCPRPGNFDGRTGSYAAPCMECAPTSTKPVMGSPDLRPSSQMLPKAELSLSTSAPCGQELAWEIWTDR